MSMAVEVYKKENESNASLLRRFSRKVRQGGIVKRAKAIQYRKRELSSFKKKQAALKRLKAEKRLARLRKLGKID